MGIKGLTALIGDNAPSAIKQMPINALFGRKIAIDASMSLYQFLIAVRSQDGQQLMNEAGETTSHLMGFFYRTIRMVENDLKPCYVFDGKPPELKQTVLKKRFSRREEAKEEGEEAKETGTAEDIERQTRRQVRVTPEQNEECRKLLTLMGIPWVVAPGEAEAQCAELCRGGLVYGAGSEDMDTLTFNSPVVLRHLTFSEQRKMPIDEIKLDEVLSGLELTMDQFIDMCMLCGCDYLEPLKGIGAKTALKLVKEHGDMEGVIEHLRSHGDGSKAPAEDWPFVQARELFKNPNVTPAKDVTLTWKEPDTEGLVEFLVTSKGFNEDRVRKGADKLRARFQSKPQGRLDSFFKPAAEDPAVKAKKDANKKRKVEEKKAEKKAAEREKKKAKKAKD